MYALDRRKRVIPVLLDDTPLSDELALIHGIDLRKAVAHNSEAGRFPDLAANPSLHQRSGISALAIAIICGVLTLIVLLAAYLRIPVTTTGLVSLAMVALVLVPWIVRYVQKSRMRSVSVKVPNRDFTVETGSFNSETVRILVQRLTQSSIRPDATCGVVEPFAQHLDL
jgi:hypothetical protein